MDDKQNDLKGAVFKLNFEVEKNQIQRFLRAVGDPTASQTAPIAFLSTFYPLHGWLEGLGLNMHAVMHAEETYEYHHPLQVGDVIDVEHRIAEAYVKNLGESQLHFVLIESVGQKTDTQQPIFSGRRLLVERRN